MPNLPTGTPYTSGSRGSSFGFEDVIRLKMAMDAERRKAAQLAYEHELQRQNVLAHARLSNQGAMERELSGQEAARKRGIISEAGATERSLNAKEADIERAKEMNKGAAERQTAAQKFAEKQKFDALKEEADRRKIPYTDADTPGSIAGKVQDAKTAEDRVNYDAYARTLKEQQGEIDRLGGRFNALSPERQQEATVDILNDTKVARYLSQHQKDRLRVFAEGKDKVTGKNGVTIEAATPDQIQSELLAADHWGKPVEANAFAAAKAASMERHGPKNDQLTALNYARINEIHKSNLDLQRKMEDIRTKNPAVAQGLGIGGPASASGGFDEQSGEGLGGPVARKAASKGEGDALDNLVNKLSPPKPTAPNYAPPGSDNLFGSTPNSYASPLYRGIENHLYENYRREALAGPSTRPPIMLPDSSAASVPFRGSLPAILPGGPAAGYNFMVQPNGDGADPGEEDVGLGGGGNQEFTRKAAVARANAIASGVPEENILDLENRAANGDPEAESMLMQAIDKYGSLDEFAPLENSPPVYSGRSRYGIDQPFPTQFPQ